LRNNDHDVADDAGERGFTPPNREFSEALNGSRDSVRTLADGFCIVLVAIVYDRTSKEHAKAGEKWEYVNIVEMIKVVTSGKQGT
jgi:hypothetical protein